MTSGNGRKASIKKIFSVLIYGTVAAYYIIAIYKLCAVPRVALICTTSPETAPYNEVDCQIATLLVDQLGLLLVSVAVALISTIMVIIHTLKVDRS